MLLNVVVYTSLCKGQWDRWDFHQLSPYLAFTRDIANPVRLGFKFRNFNPHTVSQVFSPLESSERRRCESRSRSHRSGSSRFGAIRSGAGSSRSPDRSPERSSGFCCPDSVASWPTSLAQKRTPWSYLKIDPVILFASISWNCSHPDNQFPNKTGPFNTYSPWQIIPIVAHLGPYGSGRASEREGWCDDRSSNITRIQTSNRATVQSVSPKLFPFPVLLISVYQTWAMMDEKNSIGIVSANEAKLTTPKE